MYSTTVPTILKCNTTPLIGCLHQRNLSHTWFTHESHFLNRRRILEMRTGALKGVKINPSQQRRWKWGAAAPPGGERLHMQPIKKKSIIIIIIIILLGLPLIVDQTLVDEKSLSRSSFHWSVSHKKKQKNMVSQKSDFLSRSLWSV